ncbi:hypothetical protein [Flavobacterium sp. JP2137]|uniref:hypothetical protein n=1 Tax=Flavobacterium sp. JP2137 TaxID=3414510 RepID=UPI003D2FEA03
MEEWRKIEQKIKEQLDYHTVEPSADLWNAIADKLDRSDRLERRKTWATRLWIAASVLVLLGGGAMLLFSTADHRGNADPLQQLQSHPQVEVAHPSESEEGKGSSVVDSAVAEPAWVAATPKPPRATGREYVSEVKPKPAIDPAATVAVVEPLADLDLILAAALEKTPANGFKIDSNALLREVEFELKAEYRETVFEQIKRNFKEARTNFANRNYE